MHAALETPFRILLPPSDAPLTACLSCAYPRAGYGQCVPNIEAAVKAHDKPLFGEAKLQERSLSASEAQ